MKTLNYALEPIFRLWSGPCFAAWCSACIYLWFACRHGFPEIWVSPFAYYNYQADAFLHGQLHLRLLPRHTLDLIEMDGRYYLFWPPMPAILLMPFVRIWGLGASDVLFTALLGAMNVGLVAVVVRSAVRSGMMRLTDSERGMLVLCFAFGSVHLLLASVGRVWFTGQVTALFFVLIAYVAAFADARRLRTWAAFGLAMGAVCACRYHMVMCGIWPLSQMWLRARPQERFRFLLPAAIPFLAFMCLLMLYNEARFGSPLDTGVSHMRISGKLAERQIRSGQLNIAYLPENLYNALVLYPFPYRFREGAGGSLFLLTPLFFAAFLTFRHPTSSVLPLWSTLVLAALPGLMMLGGGFFQFGPRYSLDYMAPLILLTGIGMESLPRHLSGMAVLIAIAHYTIGTLLFQYS